MQQKIEWTLSFINVFFIYTVMWKHKQKTMGKDANNFLVYYFSQKIFVVAG